MMLNGEMLELLLFNDIFQDLINSAILLSSGKEYLISSQNFYCVLHKNKCQT
jgi:hypothetical protein